MGQIFKRSYYIISAIDILDSDSNKDINLFLLYIKNLFIVRMSCVYIKMPIEYFY